MAVPPEAIVALVSGVPLAILGVLLLLVRPLRPPQVFFGLFASLWGVQVVAANLGRVLEDPAIHAAALLFSVGLAPPLGLFLVHFATRNLSPGVRWGITGAFALIALACTLTLAVAPDLLITSVRAANGRLATSFGAATNPLSRVPFQAAFVVAVLALYRDYRRAEAGTPRHRARGLLLALALVTSYQIAGGVLAGFRPAGEPAGALFGAGFRGAFFLLAGTALAVIVIHLVARPPRPEERDPTLIAAFLAPAAVAILEPVVLPSLTQPTVGFWRIATVATLAYTLARHQLFDLDLRLKRVAGPALAASAIALGAVASLALGVTGGSLAATLLPLVGAAAAAGFAYAGRARVGELLFPNAREEPDYLYQRKLEVYRAELEKALADRSGTDTPSLLGLRRELDLSDREHHVMLFLLRNAVPAPAAPQGLVPGARILGRYRIDRLLGEGGHGRAFLAYDETARRDVVVKAVNGNAFGGRAASLLLREARILQALRHRNVIAIHETAEVGSDLLIVMEYAAGGSLASHLERRRLPLEEAVAVLDGVLAGLEAAHGKGIVHRDVKPANLLLAADGTVKLADFGIAREGPATGTVLAATAIASATAGEGAGTLLYMSPEQVRGRPADARSDLYAAAVVFHQALTGRFYLRIAGKDDFQVRQLILQAPPRIEGKDLPPWVEPFMRKALAKEPEARFQSAAEMRAAIPGRAARDLAPAERV